MGHGTTDPDADPDAFWQQVKTNLQAGKIRLVFVADKIPPELQRVVEFLNSQMDPAEVLALEVKQYLGQGQKTLVPTIIGRTAAAEQKKSSGTRETKQWDEPSFLQELQLKRGEDETKVARRILKWAQSRNLRIWWGKGKISGSFFPLLDFHGEVYWLFSAWTSGFIEIQFQWMQRTPPFNQENKRIDLLDRLNQIPGIAFRLEKITKRPSISLSILRNESELDQFLKIFDWAVQEIKSYSK